MPGGLLIYSATLGAHLTILRATSGSVEEPRWGDDVMVSGEEGGSGEPEELEASKNDGAISSVKLLPCVSVLAWRQKQKSCGYKPQLLACLYLVSRRKIDL